MMPLTTGGLRTGGLSTGRLSDAAKKANFIGGKKAAAAAAQRKLKNKQRAGEARKRQQLVDEIERTNGVNEAVQRKADLVDAAKKENVIPTTDQEPKDKGNLKGFRIGAIKVPDAEEIAEWEAQVTDATAVIDWALEQLGAGPAATNDVHYRIGIIVDARLRQAGVYKLFKKSRREES